mgnify:CR=1 FL=1
MKHPAALYSPSSDTGRLREIAFLHIGKNAGTQIMHLGQQLKDGGFDGVHQPPRFRVSRAMITCWIWLVPS